MKAFTPELETVCSSSTTIDIIYVLSSSLFRDPNSYMRCASAAAAQPSLCIKPSSIACISPPKSATGSRERNRPKSFDGHHIRAAAAGRTFEGHASGKAIDGARFAFLCLAAAQQSDAATRSTTTSTDLCCIQVFMVAPLADLNPEAPPPTTFGLRSGCNEDEQGQGKSTARPLCHAQITAPCPDCRPADAIAFACHCLMHIADLSSMASCPYNAMHQRCCTGNLPEPRCHR
jgi:hypothetical protein